MESSVRVRHKSMISASDMLEAKDAASEKVRNSLVHTILVRIQSLLAEDIVAQRSTEEKAFVHSVFSP